MNVDQLAEIKKIIEEFFQKTTFDAEAEVSMQDEVISVKIKTLEPGSLIGQGGQTLMEVQHLLRVILKRKFPENFYLDLDINDYKKQKAEYLKEMAKSLADEVALTKQEKTLDPMPAYERKIIHLELSQRIDIKTESVGEGPERRLVIKPA